MDNSARPQNFLKNVVSLRIGKEAPLSAVCALLLAVLPGFPFAFFLTKDKLQYDVILRRAIVFSLVFIGAIGWLPFGDRIPLMWWLALMLVFCIAALPGVVITVRAAAAPRFVPGSRIPNIAGLIALVLLAAIQLVHPIVDWDAINYYLVGAMDTVANGHYTSYFSHFVEITPGSPNTLPPALPTLYALAIKVGRLLGTSADASLRLIPVAYIAGIWLATRRLASVFMARPWAETAALLSIIMPGMLAVIIGVPLLLDLAFTFLALQFVVEALSLGSDSAFAVGLTAGALAIEKIDGLPYVALASITLLLPRFSPNARLLLSAAAAILLPAAALRLHMLDKAPVPVTFAAIITCALVFVVASARSPMNDRRPGFRYAILAAIGFLPGALQALKLTLLTGSPAAYYLPSLATHQSALWHRAVQMIAEARIYAPTIQPGLPENFGFGLLFWWGFAPPMMLGALWGVYKGVREKEPVLWLVAIVAIVELAFLTIFGLDDFRHLLPVLPLISILAIYGFSRIPANATGATLFLCISYFASIPFAWVAQQRFFSPPMNVLQTLQIDQWHSLASRALITISIYLAILSCGGVLIIRLFKTEERTEWRWSRAILATAAVLCGLAWFEPVIATALNPGFAAQQRMVIAQQDGGYIPALQSVIERHDGNVVLTYGSFGTTWFSNATLRHAELTDASDLETIIPCMRQKQMACISALGVHSAILPAPGTAGYQALQRLLAATQLEEIEQLYSPSRSSAQSFGVWVVLRPHLQHDW